MNGMLQEERYKKITELLKQSDVVKVTELVRVLNVSVDTVRRDLENLEKKGQLKRVHGGAVLVADYGDKLSFPFREFKFKEEKAELAALACTFVSEGQAIALNAGTTNIEMARKLADSFERLTVITNGLRIVDCFSGKPGFTVIVPGGMLDHGEHALYGKTCEEQIAGYNIDIAFIAINALSLEKGLTDFRIHETGVIHAMMHAARKKIVVADSSKFEKVSYVNVCPLAEIDMIATDSKIGADMIESYRREGIRIISGESDQLP